LICQTDSNRFTKGIIFSFDPWKEKTQRLPQQAGKTGIFSSPGGLFDHTLFPVFYKIRRKITPFNLPIDENIPHTQTRLLRSWHDRHDDSRLG
jgi:hypothetical protein